MGVFIYITKNDMSRIIKIAVTLSFLFLFLVAYSANGQSRRETRAYNKAVKSGTLEMYEAFLDKYPSSVYRENVVDMIDSIHFSAVDMENMQSCLAFMNDHPESNYYSILEPKVFEMAIKQRYTQDYSLDSFKMLEDFAECEYIGNKYYSFTYANYESGYSEDSPIGMKCEYVVNMLDKKSGAVHSSMFSGKVIAGDEKYKYIVEGDYMDEGMSGSFTVPEAEFLLNKLKSCDFLLQISQGDVITDQAIEWWLKNNRPNARRLNFGILPKESSIAEMFNGQKSFESRGGYKVAFFDIRGYTVVTAYQQSSGEYILVWAEPICKDRDKDPFLNTIYFENNTSLVMYYYEGRTTHKVRVNMANKTISR